MNPLLMVLAFMFGLTTSIVGPIIAGGILPPRGRQWIGNAYTKMAMVALDRGAIVFRRHGGLDLVPMRYDVDKEAEDLTLDGETEHLTDDLNCIGWLYNKPFGLGDEASSTFTDCVWAEIGAKVQELRTESMEQRRVKKKMADGGEQIVTQMSDIIKLDETSRLMWPGSVRKTLGGNRRPTDGETAYEQGEKSQEGFHRSVSIGQATAIGVAFAIGGALVWFVANYGGAASSVDSTTLPIQMGVSLL